MKRKERGETKEEGTEETEERRDKKEAGCMRERDMMKSS